ETARRGKKVQQAVTGGRCRDAVGRRSVRKPRSVEVVTGSQRLPSRFWHWPRREAASAKPANLGTPFPPTGQGLTVWTGIPLPKSRGAPSPESCSRHGPGALAYSPPSRTSYLQEVPAGLLLRGPGSDGLDSLLDC